MAGTFFLLSAYVAYGSIGALLARKEPDGSPVGLVLAALSLVVMPTLAYLKGRTGRERGSEALVADSKEAWVCLYLSLALLLGVGLHAAFGWWWADSRDAAGDPVAGRRDPRRGARSEEG